MCSFLAEAVMEVTKRLDRGFVDRRGCVAAQPSELSVISRAQGLLRRHRAEVPCPMLPVPLPSTHTAQRARTVARDATVFGPQLDKQRASREIRGLPQRTPRCLEIVAKCTSGCPPSTHPDFQEVAGRKTVSSRFSSFGVHHQDSVFDMSDSNETGVR